MNADAAAVGATAGEHARLRTEAQLLEVAQAKGAIATDSQRAKIKELGQAADEAAMALAKAQINDNIKFGGNTSLLSPEDVQIAQQLRSIYPDVSTALGSLEAAGLRTNAALSGLSSSLSGTLTTGLTDIFDGTKTVSQGFADMSRTILRAIEEMIIKLLIVGPLMRSLQGSFGGSGLLGSLLSGGGGGVASIATGLGPAFPTFAAADGGTFGPGWGVVGERGPELIKVHNAGVTVIPNHISKPYLPGFAEGGALSAAGSVSRLPFGQNNAPAVTVNLIEDSSRGGQVEQKQNVGGGTNLTVFVDSITAKNASMPGSQTSRALDQRNRLASR